MKRHFLLIRTHREMRQVGQEGGTQVEILTKTSIMSTLVPLPARNLQWKRGLKIFASFPCGHPRHRSPCPATTPPTPFRPSSSGSCPRSSGPGPSSCCSTTTRPTPPRRSSPMPPTRHRTSSPRPTMKAAEWRTPATRQWRIVVALVCCSATPTIWSEMTGSSR